MSKYEHIENFRQRLYDLANEYKDDIAIDELMGVLYVMLQQCKYNYAVSIRMDNERKAQEK